MNIEGAWVFSPEIRMDGRGTFHEVFRLSALPQAVGGSFAVSQVNQSVSKKGVIRGIHWTEGLNGQAKFVSCSRGALWDVVVDVRPDSPTYGQWDAVEISERNGKSVFISKGLGHAFLSLENGSISNYLCSAEYEPALERTLNPLSKSLGIDFSNIGARHGIHEFLLSDRDSASPDF